MEFASLPTWWPGSSTPYLVAGPCGVESEAQIHTVAAALSESGVKVLRGGIWKPRTRPGSFQGIGDEGLNWLKEAGSSNGMQVITEVADPSHVEAAMRVGIDMVWLGARTVVNPFLVQRIAEALAHTYIPVLVKNPITPDLELWIGALERLQKVGINRLVAVHRGFTAYERSRYRNAPQWTIPIELKRRFPGLPIFTDPSHIAGTRELVASVSQTALDLGFEGLMIEVHPTPEEARSDADQQLTPVQFRELAASLVVRNPMVLDAVSLSRLEQIRQSIDVLDQELMELIARRMGLSTEIGWLKKENNVAIYQLERWSEILRTRPELSAAMQGPGLSKDFIIKLFELIHEESIHHQTHVLQAPASVSDTKGVRHDD